MQRRLHQIVPALVALLSLLACDSRQAAAPDGAVVLPDALAADLASIDSNVADAASPPVSWGACDLTRWSGEYPAPGPGIAIECTTIDVPLDHETPDDGRRITLTVARQRARQPTTPARALFFLAGGPGGSSVETSGTIPLYVSKLGETFDLVYIDQRGTGQSGFLGCQSSQHSPADESEWRACASEHSGAQLDLYGTDAAAHDIDRVRARLGYQSISLRGGSYGTRLALEYMRLHPQRVRAAVLDGVLAADTDILGDSVGAFDRGIKLLVDDCTASPSCAALCPDLPASINKLRAELAATPALITVGGRQTLLGETDFMLLLQSAIYRATFRFMVPRAICRRAEGDGQAWNQLLSTMLRQPVSGAIDPLPTAPARARRAKLAHLVQLPSARRVLARVAPRGPAALAPGLQQTILCREWLPLGPGIDALAALQAKQHFGDLSTSTLERARACASWSLSPAPAALGAPVVSDAPTLLLSGALDLQTYPQWADQAAKTLSRSKHVVIPHATHSTISVPCAAQIMTAFLEAGTSAGLDTSCVAAIKPPAW